MKTWKVTHIKFVSASVFLWLLVLSVALVSRFYGITNKPLHFDESINGWFSWQMNFVGYYKYDPTNYHGPLYFYLLQWFQNTWGRSLESLRALPAVFSVMSVMLFTYSASRRPFIERWMIVFLLFSPAFIFFGRSGIHEMPFVFFQLILFLGVLRFLQLKDAKGLGLLLVGLFGMLTLKETFVLTLAGLFLGLLSLGLQEFKQTVSWSQTRLVWNRSLTALTGLLFVFFLQLFSGFFKDLPGVFNFVKAFLPWLKTGTHGNGHEKPFYYWLQVFWQAEPLALAGVLVAVFAVFSKDKLWRFVSVFSLSQLAIYSFIPYKTVWCILSIVWGFYFVLAVCAERIWLFPRWRNLFLGIVFILTLFNMRSNYQSVYKVPIDFAHPYVYVNSTLDYARLEDLIIQQARQTPLLMFEPIQVGMIEQWPWPWVLSYFAAVDYHKCSVETAPSKAIYFCDQIDERALESRLVGTYWKFHLVLRQTREASAIYLNTKFFPEVPFEGAYLVGEGQGL